MTEPGGSGDDDGSGTGGPDESTPDVPTEGPARDDTTTTTDDTTPSTGDRRGEETGSGGDGTGTGTSTGTGTGTSGHGGPETLPFTGGEVLLPGLVGVLLLLLGTGLGRGTRARPTA